VIWAKTLSPAEAKRQMKATIVLGTFVTAATGAGMAAEHASLLVEPVVLLLSGAALIALASAVRRYVP
jgi:hypothetical protein